MEKIKALMKKCGVRPELADRLCEGIESHIAQEKSKLHSDFKQRQADAKRVCLEEVETYKRELARRLQTFCEARGGQIEQSISRQTAIKESAALTKLRNITSLLEGVEPNGEPNGALQAENAKLKRKCQKLAVENKELAGTSNRNSALAGRVLEQNRKLTTELQESRRGNGPVLSENRNTGRKPVQRIDESRQRRPSGEPITTRATLRESQERQPKRSAATQQNGDMTSPEGIAAVMETDLV